MFQPASTSFKVSSQIPMACAAHSRLKRVLDIAIALPLLIILLPVIAMICIAVRLESPGPALFRQRRGGAGGHPFMLFKVRTMTVIEDGEMASQARRSDPRVTPLGAFLRKTSLDELPQLLNVILGDMSMVGPRPHAVAHDREFKRLIPSYDHRFAVKPGITGLAQVRGYRGEISDVDSIAQRVASDIEYIESWSLVMDLGLLIATLKVPLEAKAY
jgi:putative colanic acid biosynthesis UDP-glucose lipid carrier transferase